MAAAQGLCCLKISIFVFYISFLVNCSLFIFLPGAAGVAVINEAYITDKLNSNPVLDRTMHNTFRYSNHIISPSSQSIINEVSVNEYPSPDEDYDLDYTTSPLSSMDHVDISSSAVLFADSSEDYNNNKHLKSNSSVKNESVAESDQILGSTRSHPDWWSLCQLPVFLVIFAVISVLTVTVIVLLWLKSQMLETQKGKQAQTAADEKSLQKLCSKSDDRWIFHTVINVKVGSDESSSIDVLPTLPKLPEIVKVEEKSPEKRPECVRIRAKGLLERRGSNVSLTIDLPQANAGNAPVITPTRECSTDEFLLSVGNTMCRTQLRSCLKDTISLHREFWGIPLNHPETNAVGCHTKNRYRSILPNERTRVRLGVDDGYINANYVRGYDGEEKVYIATQGPLDNTIEDFYQMVWSHSCPIIVMMTHLVEKTKPKCEKYFPIDPMERLKFGKFTVTTLEVEGRGGFVVRRLLVDYKGESRTILHYWYDTWPDHKTPQNTQAIVEMAKEIEVLRSSLKQLKTKNNNEEKVQAGPVVVHCSAGIGRTGCFIAISLAIRQLLEENKVDLLGIVCQLRYDRGGMIQTAEQYEFVHRAVAMFESSLPDTTVS